MTVVFEEVAVTVAKRIRKKFSTVPDWDDALQEALIRAWKDVQDGSYDYNHIVNRSEMWARKYLFPGSNAQKATGSSRVDTTGYVRNAAMRDKIKLFRDEYITLHGKPPTQVVVGKALGLSQHQVSYYMKRLNTVQVQRKADEKRIDNSAYRFEALPSGRHDGDSDFAPEFSKLISEESFESGLVADLAFQQRLNKFDDETRRALILHLECDWTFTDIGWHLWPDSPGWTAARSRAQRLIKKAKKELEQSLTEEDAW